MTPTITQPGHLDRVTRRRWWRTQTIARTGGFPTAPSPDWTPDTVHRWEQAKAFGDAFPSTPGCGGWYVQRVPTPAGPIVGLTVMVVVGVLALVVAWRMPTPTWMLACLPIPIAGLLAGLWIDHRFAGINLRDLPALTVRRFAAALTPISRPRPADGATRLPGGHQ